jgi:hypothetical protein
MSQPATCEHCERASYARRLALFRVFFPWVDRFRVWRCELSGRVYLNGNRLS